MTVRPFLRLVLEGCGRPSWRCPVLIRRTQLPASWKILSPVFGGSARSTSEVLSKLNLYSNDLEGAQHQDVVNLILSYLELFSDRPTRTHVLEHDIDVGGSAPIKQHAYRVNPDKRARLQLQVDYMVENGIAEPSCAWSSPCVLSTKSDGSDRFCTDSEGQRSH